MAPRKPNPSDAYLPDIDPVDRPDAFLRTNPVAPITTPTDGLRQPGPERYAGPVGSQPGQTPDPISRSSLFTPIEPVRPVPPVTIPPRGFHFSR